jgi:hypothetical protein
MTSRITQPLDRSGSALSHVVRREHPTVGTRARYSTSRAPVPIARLK